MESTICSRCGWYCKHVKAPVIEGWPDHLPPPPPLPDSFAAHPIGDCCSPFKIGQNLFWDLGGADPDLPPIRVLFEGLTEIASPDFSLVDGEWVKESEPTPKRADVFVVEGSVYPQHRSLLGDALKEIMEVQISGLTAIERWPVLEVEVS